MHISAIECHQGASDPPPGKHNAEDHCKLGALGDWQQPRAEEAMKEAVFHAGIKHRFRADRLARLARKDNLRSSISD
jgi:hypothetical protein